MPWGQPHALDTAQCDRVWCKAAPFSRTWRNLGLNLASVSPSAWPLQNDLRLITVVNRWNGKRPCEE